MQARAAMGNFILLCHRHRHLHPRRCCRCGWGCGAATAVLWLLCCGCCWCFLSLFLKNKKLAVVCCGDHDRGDRAKPSCCAAIHLAGPATATSTPAAAAAAAAVLLLMCGCCCAVVLTLSYTCSNSAMRSLLPSCYGVPFCMRHLYEQ